MTSYNIVVGILDSYLSAAAYSWRLQSSEIRTNTYVHTYAYIDRCHRYMNRYIWWTRSPRVAHTYHLALGERLHIRASRREPQLTEVLLESPVHLHRLQINMYTYIRYMRVSSQQIVSERGRPARAPAEFAQQTTSFSCRRPKLTSTQGRRLEWTYLGTFSGMSCSGGGPLVWDSRLSRSAWAHTHTQNK